MIKRLRELFSRENKDAHKAKNRYIVEMMNIHTQAKIQVRVSQRTVTMIENSTAYRVARATGRLK